MKREYLSGFGNLFESEAEKGALPRHQNSPQKTPKNLYPEQLSGTAFTAPRDRNRYAWLYKIQPSVVQGEFSLCDEFQVETPAFDSAYADPTPMRWNPMPALKGKQDFLSGMRTVVGAGAANEGRGLAIHLYAANESMEGRYFYSADGELLIVPQEGSLEIRTELGILDVEPLEIAVIPRGMKFRVLLKSKSARGYVAENFGAAFRIPDLGPIGANGLANPRHFLAPTAAVENLEGRFELIAKFGGRFFKAKIKRSPLDVVAWYGNYVPYKYDLRLFNTIGTVSYDHPDPSIFTVLTSPSEVAGTANIDFVIFPPRWMVADNTFRPPYFHRNCMNEYMGLIQGTYDAKEGGGFAPGGGSLHNAFTGHGPDAATYKKATEAKLAPTKIQDTMAFMLETRWPYAVTSWGRSKGFLQSDYAECWQTLKPQR
jgi:homogentisate 1,2-dioxygenase